MKTRKEYQKPETEVITLQMESPILVASPGQNSLNYSNTRTESVNDLTFWNRASQSQSGDGE